MLPWTTPDIAKHPDPFMEHRPQQVEAAQLLHDPVADLLFVGFRFERPEHLVPNDEDPGIVTIKVSWVRRVMDPVVRRRVHYSLEPARHPVDRLGMDPELVDQIETTADRDHRRMKSEQHKWNGKEEPEGESPGPALPECRRKIVVLAGMVVHMAGPHPPNAVPGAVDPVILQIVQYETNRPCPPN